jgi:hypothetical protein
VIVLPNNTGKDACRLPCFFWGKDAYRLPRFLGKDAYRLPRFFARRLARIGSAVGSTNLGSLTLCWRFPKITKVLAPKLD